MSNTKSNRDRPAVEVPTEWRRIVLEERSDGSVVPVAVEDVPDDATGTSTRAGNQAESGATEQTAKTHQKKSEVAHPQQLTNVPSEWQDVFFEEAAPPPSSSGQEISLQTDNPDFGELTLPGMSFPEFYEGDQEEQSEEPAQQQQQGEWQQQQEQQDAQQQQEQQGEWQQQDAQQQQQGEWQQQAPQQQQDVQQQGEWQQQDAQQQQEQQGEWQQQDIQQQPESGGSADSFPFAVSPEEEAQKATAREGASPIVVPEPAPSSEVDLPPALQEPEQASSHEDPIAETSEADHVSDDAASQDTSPLPQEATSETPIINQNNTNLPPPDVALAQVQSLQPNEHVTEASEANGAIQEEAQYQEPPPYAPTSAPYLSPPPGTPIDSAPSEEMATSATPSTFSAEDVNGQAASAPEEANLSSDEPLTSEPTFEETIELSRMDKSANPAYSSAEQENISSNAPPIATESPITEELSNLLQNQENILLRISELSQLVEAMPSQEKQEDEGPSVQQMLGEILELVAVQQEEWGKLQTSLQSISQSLERLEGEVGGHTLYGVLQDVLLLYDFVELRRNNYQGQQIPEDDPRMTEVVAIRARVLELLTRQGLTPIEVTHSNFDPTCQRVLQEIPAYSPQEDGLISRIFRQGFYLKDEVFRPVEVEVKRYSQS